MRRLALLHPTGLLGKELRETLAARPAFAAADVRLLSDDPEEIGALTEAAGEAALVQAWEPGALDGVETVFFCGPAAATRRLLAEKPEGVTAIVLSLDATAEDGRPVVAGVTAAAERGAVLLSPHPAVILLAHLLWPLRAVGVEEAVATLVQPASMQGQPGLEEMFDQTRQIVAMTARTPSPVFGHQMAFNLLPHPGPIEPLAAQLAEVLRGEPVVSLNVVQGGVFHSFSASLYLRTAADPGPKALRRALSAHPHVELTDDPKHLGPIEVPGSDKVVVGAVRKETGGAGGYWIWAVMDNLTRGGAVNAADIAEAVTR